MFSYGVRKIFMGFIFGSIVLCNSHITFGQTYGQRGVAYRDAFSALFEVHYPRNFETFHHTAEAVSHAPVFVVGPSATPFDSPTFATMTDRMAFYANAGSAAENHYIQRGFHSVHMNATRLKKKFPNARGYILTYQADQFSDLAYTGFFQTQGLEVKHLIQKPVAWGVSPAPIVNPTTGMTQYAEGDASVFGPAHPLSNYQPPLVENTGVDQIDVVKNRGRISSLGQAGRGIALGIGFGILTDYGLAKFLPPDVAAPTGAITGLYGGAAIDAYLLKSTTFSASASTNAAVLALVLARHSWIEIARISETSLWERDQALISIRSGEMPASLYVQSNGERQIIPHALRSTIFCHSPVAQAYSAEMGDLLRTRAETWRWLRRHGYRDEPMNQFQPASQIKPSSCPPQIKPLMDFIVGSTSSGVSAGR